MNENVHKNKEKSLSFISCFSETAMEMNREQMKSSWEKDAWVFSRVSEEILTTALRLSNTSTSAIKSKRSQYETFLIERAELLCFGWELVNYLGPFLFLLRNFLINHLIKTPNSSTELWKKHHLSIKTYCKNKCMYTIDTKAEQ